MRCILLVDDDPILRSTLPLVLGLCGYHAVAASDGREALRLLRSQAFDLVLTDVLMPEIDGLEVVQAVRREFPELPIVAMSGGSARLPGSDALQLAHRLGAHAILPKPFSEYELRETLARFLPPNQAAWPVAPAPPPPSVLG